MAGADGYFSKVLRSPLLVSSWNVDDTGQGFRTAALVRTKEIETQHHETCVWLGSWSPSLWLYFPNIFKLEEVLPQQKIRLWDDKQSSQPLHSPVGLWGKPFSWILAQINVCLFQLCLVKNALGKVTLINLTLRYSCSKYHPDLVNGPAPLFILKACLASSFSELSNMSEIWKQTERKCS